MITARELRRSQEKPYEAIEPEVEGTYHLSGIQAVSYMRIRYGYGLEFRRTLRQRAVVLKMVEKMKSASLPTLYRCWTRCCRESTRI